MCRSVVALVVSLFLIPLAATTVGPPAVSQDILKINATFLRPLAGQGGAAYAINELGWAVGGSPAANGKEHAVIWLSPGPPIDLGTLGGLESKAEGVNNLGEVVGGSTDAAGEWRAFLIRPVGENGDEAPDVWVMDADGNGVNDLMTDLGALGGSSSYATDISDSGYVVGSAQLAGGSASHAFRWRNGEMTDLGALDPRGSGARGVNESGQAVGYTWVSAGAATLLHAALWDADGTIRDLAHGDAGSSDVWAINDTGTVVGTFRGSTWAVPVVWSADAWAYLPSMGDGAAYGVNSLDEIVGATRRSTSDPARPALWQDRALVDPALFEAPGAYSIVYDLNDLGWMAGSNGASKEFPAQEAVIWKIVESAGKAQGRIDEVKAKLDALIEERKLTRGQGNALKAKLDAAIEMIAEKEAAPLAFAAIVAYAAPLKGNPAAVNVLEAFINQVEAFVRARILTEEDGQALIRSVRVIIARMGG